MAVMVPVRPRVVPLMMALVRPGLMMVPLRGRATAAAIGKRVLAGQSQPGGQTQSNHPRFHDAPRDMTTRLHPIEAARRRKSIYKPLLFASPLLRAIELSSRDMKFNYLI
jgi:hypothetical protein